MTDAIRPSVLGNGNKATLAPGEHVAGVLLTPGSYRLRIDTRAAGALVDLVLRVSAGDGSDMQLRGAVPAFPEAHTLLIDRLDVRTDRPLIQVASIAGGAGAAVYIAATEIQVP